MFALLRQQDSAHSAGHADRRRDGVDDQDAEMAFMIKTSGLKLIHDGTEVFINDSQPISPLGALVHLVRDHGFREDVARYMLKRAEAKRSFKARVKYANPYLTQSGPST